MGERFRGSSDIPLTGEGLQQAADVGMKLARRGGVDEIHTSSLGRAVQTAKQLSRYTHAPIVDITDRLHPWHLGEFEGQETSPEKHTLMNSLVSDHPDESIPGRGPLSVADGESFNSFKERTLGKVQELLAKSAARPDLKIAAVTHYRDKKLVEAWLRKGAQPNGTIDTEEMNRHSVDNNPAGVDRLHMDPYAGPQFSAVDLESPQQLQGGVYLVRHGATAWNGDQS